MGESDDASCLAMENLPEPCFNELSVHPLCTSAKEMENRVNKLIGLLKRLRQYGFARVRCEHGLYDFKLSETLTLHEYCKSLSNQGWNEKNNAAFLYSCIRKPYLNSQEETSFESYSDVKYCSDETKNEWSDCYGLYVAYLLGSFTISLDSGGCNNTCYKLKLFSPAKDGSPKLVTQEVSVMNVADVNQLDTSMDIIDTISNMPINVPVSGVLKKESFTLPAHHGKKECIEHGKRLLDDPYVVDILNSIDFDSSEHCYIHSVKPDGIIEIRLYWTKLGYGLSVLTSARDIIDAWWIAKRLEKNYG